MLSDESSSDSETGRFKCRTKSQDEQSKSNRKEDSFRLSTRTRPISDRFQKELERPSRDDRGRHDRYPRDRNRFSRQSPPRRRTRERSFGCRSHERHRHSRDFRSGTKSSRRSSSRDRRRDSKPRSHRSPDRKRDFKQEIKQNISREKSEEKPSKTREKVSHSPDPRGKRSEVYIPPPAKVKKSKSKSPIVVEEHSDTSDDVQPGSYYSMIPAVVKEKSEESSEIDSSDDEKLRAKLLNLEKELHKTKKRKHKKKHKKKHSRSKDREQDNTNIVEVSSTTDIQDNMKNDEHSHSDAVEVSSTQKSTQKESGEEGEIISDDDSQNQYEIDPNDLRHKLKRSVFRTQAKTDICGPALPPHLEKRHRGSTSPVIEGPALPPHLQKSKHIGPSIPDDMRKMLSETDSKYESPDEEDGIGPLPAGSEEKWSEAHQRLEERALDMKIRKLDGHTLQKSDIKTREEWMLKLPEGKAKYLGLEARSFRAKEGPDMSDRSSWTDTPEDKARKSAGIQKEEDMDAALRKDARARQIANRDDEQEDAIRKHKKKHKREESLLEMHEKKIKKKKKKEEKDESKSERRPFSRDVDLQVNRFDEAQKKSIIKKAQGLDSRFSRGEAKYL
ncbi:unnamed protein product [Diatraea saccharalis]|uniref:DUF3752 domain-containing protein n=1 Tax=Diatraea saccharalis TaxID=40085 RepID=A0A9N9N252_9NEOP|nr:unnamed protein product [Diatraea saccharalis]